MILASEIELANTQRKLSELEKLIMKREHFPSDSEAHELSLESMRRFAHKLRAEIDEYQCSHQTVR